ncbi:MAG: L-histidine N(alpha)-methyltransferase, partial [Pseudomonadales bacterium]|nr:L-histidine N(alpha)-methyltransferase [Pseudomonadales bacterium]
MSSNGDYSFHDFKPGREDMAAEVLRGITGVQKYISPKFFYDEKGSVLFEQITTLPEYYLTRTEMALFDAKLPEISSFLPADLCVIEYGSGSSLKIRKLLQGLT